MRTFLFGLLLGAIAGVMYAPAKGNRTRAIVRDKMTKYSNDTTDILNSKSRHIRNKMQGLKAQLNKATDELQKQARDVSAQIKSA